MSQDRFLTVTEVAQRLRVNPESVRRWLRQGRLKGFRFGGDKAGYRIPASELERFIVSDGQAPKEA